MKEELLLIKPSPKLVLQEQSQVRTELKEKPRKVIPVAEKEVTKSALTPPPIFQAIGVIVGEVSINELPLTSTITIQGNTFPLFYASNHKHSWEALKKSLTNDGKGKERRLIVYPKVIHFPKKEQSYVLGFQLVGFDNGQQQGAIKELRDNEFKLRGLWQFIPVCPTPCISIFRNYSEERKRYVKSSDSVTRVRFMKASHIPLIWKDSPVKPFRFNPKLQKEEQGKRFFVELTARFLPGRNVFGALSLLAPPLDTPPRFLKAGKEDKANALKLKRELEKNQ